MISRPCLTPILLALLAGCPGGDHNGPPEDACALAAMEVPTATLGTGSTLFAGLADGDDVEIHQGAQGGFHVWGSVRVTGLYAGDSDHPGEPENPELVFQVTDQGGALVGDTGSLRRPLKVRRDGQVELVGEIVPLMIGSVDDLAFQQATITVSVVDFCGTTVMDTRSVRLIPGT